MDLIATIVDGLVVLEAAGKFVEGEELTRFLLDKLSGRLGSLENGLQLYLARFLSAQGRFAEADKAFKKVADAEEENSGHYIKCQYNLFMGEHKLANGDYVQAAKMFDKALRIHEMHSTIEFSPLVRIQDAIERAKNAIIDRTSTQNRPISIIKGTKNDRQNIFVWSSGFLTS